ncbi:MAG: hypothetical protein KGM47_17820 [Acidobacteriota bacterium]|nr:hypothetical protein [Acidobacteriota bacterium]
MRGTLSQVFARIMPVIAAALVAAAMVAAAQPSEPPPAASQPAVRTSGRDPFKLPPPPLLNSKGMGIQPLDLPPGVRGLIISTLKLEGVVSEDSGREMIAVVTNDTQRAYFLRVNERLYDGVVTQITPQAVTFSEWKRDDSGRESLRTVVRRLNQKAGDGQ